MIPNNIKDICELFDCQVCKDLDEKPGFKKKVITQDDYPKNLVAVCYLGQYPENDLGYSLTKAFFTISALEKYCRSKKGREKINQRAGEIFPDWDTINQEWRE